MPTYGIWAKKLDDKISGFNPFFFQIPKLLKSRRGGSGFDPLDISGATCEKFFKSAFTGKIQYTTRLSFTRRIFTSTAKWDRNFVLLFLRVDIYF